MLIKHTNGSAPLFCIQHFVLLSFYLFLNKHYFDLMLHLIVFRCIFAYACLICNAIFSLISHKT